MKPTVGQAARLAWSGDELEFGDEPVTLSGQVELAYNPREPRDTRGRWTRFGGVERAAGTMAKEREGFSVSPFTGDTPPPGYMVAQTGSTHTYPEQILDDHAALTRAIDDMLMSDPSVFGGSGRTYLGGWVHGGKLWLEPSDHFNSKDEATRAGRDRNQIAIFDLHKFEEIDTGGSGGGRITEHDIRGRPVRTYTEGAGGGPAELSAAAPGGAPGGSRETGGQDPAWPAGGIGSQLLDLAFNPLEKRDSKGRWTLGSLNPTGSVFAQYDPQSRATAPLGPNMATLAETQGVHPDTPLRVYRGAPAGQQGIVPGDFITDNPQLARDYAGSGKVLSLDVTYGDVLDDRTEPGGGEYIYRPREMRGYEGRYVGPERETFTPDLTPARGVKALTSKGRPDGAGTPDDPIDVQGNIDRAILLMAQGRHVRLNQVSEIVTLVGKVDQLAADFRKHGQANPKWDFGYITVRGTDLFTAQTRGIPRIRMPQLGGPAQPGTPAAALAKKPGGFVDLADQFRKQLIRDGIPVHDERVNVAHLRSTQTQLTATTVAGIAEEAHRGEPGVLAMLKDPIWVSRDNYVIDGHHRWAAKMVLDSFDGVLGDDTTMDVHKIDMDIGAVLPYANEFAQRWGIAPVALGNTKLIQTAGTLSGQVLELRGFDPHELRDFRGRWTRGAVAHEGPSHTIWDRIIAEWRMTKDPEVKSDLDKASDSWAADDTDGALSWLGNAAYYAEENGDHSRARRISNVMKDIRVTRDNPPPGTPPAAVRDVAARLATVVPKVLGGGKSGWNGKVGLMDRETNPWTYAQIDWNGKISMREDFAARLAEMEKSAPGTPLKDPEAYQILVHEMVHSDIPEDETYEQHSGAYQDKPRAAMEEGFTELGATQHAAEVFDAIGIGSRKTNMIAIDAHGNALGTPVNPSTVKAVIRSLEASRPSLTPQAAPRVTAAEEALKQSDLDSAMQYLGQAVVRTPLESRARATLTASLKALGQLDSETPLQHATMSEYARRLDDPARITNGDAVWGHYGWQTALAQKWVSEIAAAEGKPGRAREVELADEINRQGSGAKMATMMWQAVRAAAPEPQRETALKAVYEQLYDQLRDRWTADRTGSAAEKALKAVRAWAAQQE